MRHCSQSYEYRTAQYLKNDSGAVMTSAIEHLARAHTVEQCNQWRRSQVKSGG